MPAGVVVQACNFIEYTSGVNATPYFTYGACDAPVTPSLHTFFAPFSPHPSLHAPPGACDAFGGACPRDTVEVLKEDNSLLCETQVRPSASEHIPSTLEHPR